jgi:signal transduction histidine kinase
MLVLAPTWFAREERFEGFHVEDTPLLTPKGIGLCGRAWASGQPEWIADIAAAAPGDFLRIERAVGFGLRGAYAYPVVGPSRVVAVLMFFSADQVDADQPEVEAASVTLAQITEALVAKLRDAEAAASRRRLVYDSQSTAVRELVREITGDVLPLISAIAEWSDRCTREIRALAPTVPHAATIATGSEGITAAARRARGLMRRLEPLVGVLESAEPEAVDVNEIVRSVLSALRPTAPHGTRLRMDLDPSAPPLHARRDEFERCVFCLVENAIEAVARTTDASGEVSVTTSYRDGSIEIQVRDTGCGLTSVVADNMTSPLFTTKQHGLGMGLVVARKVVEAIGGSLSGEPNADRGATFRIALPAPPPS